jgi:hypothetical protein
VARKREQLSAVKSDMVGLHGMADVACKNTVIWIIFRASLIFNDYPVNSVTYVQQIQLPRHCTGYIL